MKSSIQCVVDQHLCTQCGTCVAVCPFDAIEMQETPAGALLPIIDQALCLDCGKCLKCCPGMTLEIPEFVNSFLGNVVATYVGHASDHEIRSKGQSGGVVSALLLYLLNTGQVDRALVTVMPSDGSLRPQPVLAKSRDDVLSAQGSKYCPVAANTILNSINENERIVVVGPACQMHGIQKLSQTQNGIADKIGLRIGLFCDRTLLFTCIDQMAKDTKCDLRDMDSLEYRSKVRSGWPGEVCFHDKSGRSFFFPSTIRMLLKEYFTPPRCRLCFDKLNVLSDFSVGDSYNVSESRRGSSVIIARNVKAKAMLDDACEKGFLKLKKIDAQLVYEGQDIDQRRKNFIAFSEAWQRMGGTLPEYTGLGRGTLPSVSSALKKNANSILRLNHRIVKCQTKQATLRTVRLYRSMYRFKRSRVWKTLTKLKELCKLS